MRSRPRRSDPVAAPQCVADVVGRPGVPLAPDVRAGMEDHFGHDFSGVTVHTDPGAQDSARTVQAKAYTVGSHVVFGAGQFAPATSDGRSLLAHELAHVVQQNADSALPPGAATERCAVGAAQDVAAARPVSVPQPPTGVGLARTPLSSSAFEPDDAEDVLTLKPVDSGKPASEMTWTQLQDALDDHNAYIAQQISSTPEVLRREKRIAELEAAQRALGARAAAPAAKASRRKGKATAALPPRPQSLERSLDLSVLSPTEIKAELDRVVAYLAANPPKKERETLQAELPYLEEAAETARSENIAAQRKESLSVALSPTAGDEAAQLSEMLHRVEQAQRDPSGEGRFLIHYDGLVFPIDAPELEALRKEVARGLVRGASDVNNFLGDVALAWRERYQHNKRQWIVHGLVKFATGASDISPKSINQMVDVGNFYVGRIKERGRSGQLIEAGNDLLVFDNYARYWSNKVGDWESTLVGGAGRWVLALTIAKEALTILTGYSAAKLAGGGSFFSTLKTGAKITALTTGTGAAAGGIAAEAAGRDWREGVRAGGGAGFGVGANALTAGVGKIASIGDAAKATSYAKKAYAVGKAVTVEAGANVATGVTQAAIEGGDKGKAALAALASSPISTLGGGVVDKFAKGRAAVAAGRTVVGGTAGFTGALASDGNLLAGTLIGGGGGLYGGLASPLPGASVGTPAAPEVLPAPSAIAAGTGAPEAVPVAPVPGLGSATPTIAEPQGGSPRSPDSDGDAVPVSESDIISETSAGSTSRREVGHSEVLGDNEVDAWRAYQKWRADDPSREVALIYNHAQKQWAVVQGSANNVDTIGAAQALGWNPGETSVSGRHNHPAGPSGVTPTANLHPSGRFRDMDMIRSDASKSEHGSQWSAIDVTTVHGADSVYVFYDRKSNRFTVRSPEPSAGPGQYQWHSFPNVEAYHAWYRNRFGHDPSPVSFGSGEGSGSLSAGSAVRTSSRGDVIDEGGTIERPTPTPSEYSVSENFGDPHPHVEGETESRYHVRATMENGVMSADFMLRRMDVRGFEGEFHRSNLRGRDEFMAAVDHFQSGDPNAIREIKGDWGQGDNLDAFNTAYAEAKRSGLDEHAALVQAAAATATGQWSAEAGFSAVRIESVEFGPYGLVIHVDARFSRP